jgi:indoleacetamide hydrolase
MSAAHDQQPFAGSDLVFARAAADLSDVASLGAAVRVEQVAATGSGLLDGRSVLVKANIAVDGWPLTGGCPALADHVADGSASAVERMLAAGATVVGHANMHELAFGVTSVNAHHGPVSSPYGTRRSALGSSGGSAAAVGSGAVDMALGTDTGGSGRLPAAACGCVGLRPSSGRYPGDGVLDLTVTLDTISSMARSVGDLAELDSVLAGDGDGPLAVLSHSTIRLGVPSMRFWDSVASTMADQCMRALELLRPAGVELIDIDLVDPFDAASEVATPIALGEAGKIWTEFARQELGLTLAEFTERIASADVAAVFEAIVAGVTPSDEELAHMVNTVAPSVRWMIEERIVEHRLDAIVYPTLVAVPPPISRADVVDIDGVELPIFAAMTRRELVASVAGLPALSLPGGFDADGMPFGLEFVGAFRDDRHLLAVAAAVEALLDVRPDPVVRPTRTER